MRFSVLVFIPQIKKELEESIEQRGSKDNHSTQTAHKSGHAEYVAVAANTDCVGANTYPETNDPDDKRPERNLLPSSHKANSTRKASVTKMSIV